MGRNIKIMTALVAVLVSVALAYSNSFYGVFVYDDFINIVNNPDIRSLPSAITGTSRPLTNFTFYIQHRLGVVRTADFHLVNLMLHLLSTFLLWRLLWALGRDAGAGDRRRMEFSVLAAFIWALHPVQTESVTYIVQRAEPLSAVFLFGALLAGISYIARKVRVWAALTLLFLLLACAGKPTAVCGPLLLLALDSLVYSRGLKQALCRRWKFHVLSFATLLFPAVLLTGSHESVTSAGFTMNILSPSEYLAFQPRALVLYLGVFVWPAHLLIDYGYDLEAALLPVVFFLLLLALITRYVWRAGGFARTGILWFYLAMAPVIFVPLADLFAEHRLYIPSVGLSMIAAECICVLFQKTDALRLKSRRPLRMCLSFLVVILFGALGLRTWYRNADYCDPLVLWRQVVDRRPENVRGYLGVGAAMARRGMISESEQIFRQGVEIYKKLDSEFLKESFRTDYAYLCMNTAVILKARGEDQGSGR